MTDLRVILLDRAEEVATLRAAWDRLREAASVWSVAQGIDYVLVAWEVVSRRPGVRLAVVTVWRGDELACVWPLYVRREGGLTVACHMGCGGHEEYAGPLIAGEGETAREAGRLALAAASRLADVLRVYNVRVPSVAAEVLEADTTPRRQGSVGSPVMSLKAFSDGDAWLQSRSRNLRSALRTDRRRLRENGELSLQEMSGPRDGPRVIDWMFAQKRGWLAERKIHKSWMLHDEARHLFTALAARPHGDRPLRGDFRVYGLSLDGKLIAALFGFGSSDRFEAYSNAYDPALSDFSLGSLIIEDCARQAISAGLDFDFRITHEPYKKRWVDRFDRYDTYILGCTPRGVVAVSFEKLNRQVRVFRAKYGPRIKGWLRRTSSRPAPGGPPGS